MISPEKGKEIISKLIGSTVQCTLKDGRTVTGTLICIDRSKNIILSNCCEERMIHSNDYSSIHPSISKQVGRELQAAMIPGEQLISVHITTALYEQNVIPFLVSS